jgi:L-2-amino-thiazoline-4-carboxylic acid hydrolase
MRNLATYIKLSVLALVMAKQHQTYGLSEHEIGERIYRTADEYFGLSTVRKWIQRTLFFSGVNIRHIKERQDATSRSENGINGFKLRYVEGATRDEFGVDYLSCGTCEYFERKGMFEYVKYLCLVDYAIMKNMGIPFSRTTTLGNNGLKCDFRFSKEGTIVEGWPPSELQEFQQ